MRVRLACQDEGVTNPPAAIKEATRALVERLSTFESYESIQVVVLSSDPVVARYVHTASGDVLAEIRGDRY